MSVVDLYKIISDYEFVKIVGTDYRDVIYFGLNLKIPGYLLEKQVLKLSHELAGIVIYV